MDEIKFLKKCNTVYEDLVRHLTQACRSDNEETVLALIQEIARFASSFHTGRYTDGRIENIAVKIGERLNEVNISPSKNSDCYIIPTLHKKTRRHVLHVATEIHPIGGHTRLIKNWIKNDKNSIHSLVLTAQKNSDLPPWMIQTVIDNGGQFINFPAKAPIVVKAMWLRQISQSGIDVIILHHHPYDVIPTVAFATKNCPPVGLLNHADHVFWLGSSVADTVINLRNSGMKLSQDRRFVRHNNLLPIPLSRNGAILTHEIARERLNIPKTQVVLLSVGSAFKYTPTNRLNFFRTAVKILNENPSVHIYLIGIKCDDGNAFLRDVHHDRMHFLGVIENPALYQAAADLYIEGFPFGSATALLEPCLLGVPPVLPYEPKSRLLVTDSPALDGVVCYAHSEEEYISKVNALISSEIERKKIGYLIKERVENFHVGDGWNSSLKSLYHYLDQVSHSYKGIPASVASESNDDTELSLFHLVINGDSILLNFADRILQHISPTYLARLFFSSIVLGEAKLDFGYLRRWASLIKERITMGELYKLDG